MNENFGESKSTQTGTANGEPGASLDSSQGQSRRSNSAKLAKRSPGNSTSGQGADAGGKVETRLTSLDVLLSLLQSDLTKIRSLGGEVRLYLDPDGLGIKLPGVTICQIHKQFHSGETCPHC